MPASNEKYVPALRFDFLTALYDPVVRLTTREETFKSALLRQARIARGERVLDLGAGTGTLAIRAKSAQPGAEVFGVDGDERILEIARRKASRARVKTTFDRALATSLPYATGSFDKVLSSLFFHHLSRSDKLAAMREALRVLKPGGEVHVADWGRASSRLMGVLFLAVRVLDGFDNTADNAEGALPELLRLAGFEKTRLRGALPTMFGTLALYSGRKPDSGGGAEEAGRD